MNTIIVPEHLSNKRIDKILAEIFSEYSRSQLQKWLSSGYITVDGKTNCPPKEKVAMGTEIIINQEAIDNIQQEHHDLQHQAQNIELDIIYQDEDIIIINKQAGLVVHPAAGNWSGTLVNSLLYHFPDLANMPRAGIVHRLDKDTSGLMVVARNLKAHNSIVKQLQERTVKRRYVALVNGHLITSGQIEQYMGRHPSNRLKMAVLDSDNKNAKYALTYYKILKKYPKHTLLELSLSTGRTHQIRVHMAYLGYPIVGDKLYGRIFAPLNNLTAEEKEYWQSFGSQALSATQLSFIHPRTNKTIEFAIDIPQDITKLITILDK